MHFVFYFFESKSVLIANKLIINKILKYSNYYEKRLIK